MERIYRFNIISTIIIVFLGLKTLSGQEQPFQKAATFKNISVDQGLSQSIIRTILQDNDGFMWFSTTDGLNRYDGFDFKVFKHDSKDSTSIASDQITAMFMSETDDLWLGGNKNHISKYNKRTESFLNFSLDFESDEEIVINAIKENRSHQLWIGTSNGLFLYDPKTKNLEKVDFHNLEDTSVNYISTIYGQIIVNYKR